MNLTKHVCVAALAAAFASTPALAAPYATASIDLTSLRFSLEDTDAHDGITASFSDQLESSFADVTLVDGGPTNWAHTSSPDETMTASNLSAQVQAVATAAPEWLGSTVVGPGTTGRAGVNATTQRQLAFTGTGRFTAEVDYSLAAGLGGAATWREVLAWVGIVIFPAGGSAFQTEELVVAPGGISPISSLGRLSLSFNVFDGQSVIAAIRTHTHSLAAGPIAAPVPEPATWALMLAGLVGVARVTRRRKS